MMAPEPPQTATTQKTSVGVNVTTKTEATPIATNLELNHLYFIQRKTGILKLVQLVIGIICMGCGSPALVHYVHFFMFVVVIFFIITLLLCFIHLFTIQRLLPQVPWQITELLITFAAVILYFIAAVVMLAMTSRADYSWVLSYHNYYSAYMAAGVFAVFNWLAYGVAMFFHYLEWKQSKPTTTSPAPNGNAA